MSSEPQVLLFDGDLSEDDLPSAFAALDAEAARPLRPDLSEFMKVVLMVEGVGEVDPVGGSAILITAPAEHIAHLAEYVLRYRPGRTTLVEPLTFSILRHWTDIEDVFVADEEVDPEAEVKARAVLDGIIEALQLALPPSFGQPSIRTASLGVDVLLAAWRYIDDARVLVVECSVEVYGPEVRLAATVSPMDSISRWNRDEPSDPLNVESADLWEIEAMDEAESWAVTVASPTKERVLAAAYDDLSHWIAPVIGSVALT